MPLFQSITKEDIDDLGGISPFALEPSKISQYDFKYVGKEQIDELDLHVFDVSPKVMPNAKKTKERFFMGRVWVDEQDLQIVKTRGKGVPETKEKQVSDGRNLSRADRRPLLVSYLLIRGRGTALR